MRLIHLSFPFFSFSSSFVFFFFVPLFFSRHQDRKSPPLQDLHPLAVVFLLPPVFRMACRCPAFSPITSEEFRLSASFAESREREDPDEEATLFLRRTSVEFGAKQEEPEKEEAGRAEGSTRESEEEEELEEEGGKESRKKKTKKNAKKLGRSWEQGAGGRTSEASGTRTRDEGPGGGEDRDGENEEETGDDYFLEQFRSVLSVEDEEDALCFKAVFTCRKRRFLVFIKVPLNEK